MNNSIIETAKEIRVNVINHTLDHSKYIEFNNSFPKFYIILQRKDMDESMFNKLLTLISTHSVEDQNAASEFSQFGAEKYLYPQFGKPSTSNLNAAKRSIKKRS